MDKRQTGTGATENRVSGLITAQDDGTGTPNNRTSTHGGEIHDLVQPPTNHQPPTYHYPIQETLTVSTSHPLTYSASCDAIPGDLSDPFFSSFPSFVQSLQGADLIHIPVKVNRVIERHIGRNVLRSIHHDLNTARELCLVILSNLSDTYYRNSRYKRLSSELMHRQTSTSSQYVYRRILDLLVAGSPLKGPIIQQGEEYSHGTRCREYGLSDTYFAKGVEPYRIQTDHVRKLRNREFYKLLSEASNNVIARNLLRIYPDIELPDRDMIHAEAKLLVAQGYHNKKGRKLVFLNNNARLRWKNQNAIAFVEDSVEVYDLLTANGFIIPVVGDDHSGGRIVDSFALMPSWIRSMTSIDGERMVEADYSALHPNLIQKIYRGPLQHITHQQIANELGIAKDVVKTHHLALFNRRSEDMEKSPIYKFYMDCCPEMMARIHEDKAQHGYRVTSRRLFRAETDLMTSVISDLNSKEVNALYIYDALMVAKPHHRQLINTMNQNAARMNIHTTAS